MRFSERKGLKSVRSIIQVDSIDDELRIGLWNALSVFYWSNFEKVMHISSHPGVKVLLHFIWRDHFKKPTDTIPEISNAALKLLRDYFFRCEWYEVYDFVEFVANSSPSQQFDSERLKRFCNEVLEREMSAYRFVDDRITQITSLEEIAEVEDALSDDSKFAPVIKHLRSALQLLSDRKTPDYRNSIKESLSAVESACNIIAGSKVTLGQALKELETRMHLHPALKNAFSNLYGYASDAEGIRHGLLSEGTLDSSDARFMLVTCSAFVNYLRSKIN